MTTKIVVGQKMIAIDVWHPSYTGVSDKEFYEEAVDTLYDFINDHKGFLNSHRS